MCHIKGMFLLYVVGVVFFVIYVKCVLSFMSCEEHSVLKLYCEVYFVICDM